MNLRLKSTDLGCEGLWRLGNTGLSDIQVTNRTWKEEFFQLFFTALPVCLDESCRSPAPGWTSCCGAAGLPVWRAGRIPEQFYRNQKCSTGSCWWSPQRGTGKEKRRKKRKEYQIKWKCENSDHALFHFQTHLTSFRKNIHGKKTTNRNEIPTQSALCQNHFPLSHFWSYNCTVPALPCLLCHWISSHPSIPYKQDVASVTKGCFSCLWTRAVKKKKKKEQRSQ